eukprot:Nitzschia sp. Nitz4//scaffold39_size137210//79096//80589//NITZ4_003207-RA/size137210-augustus-gene-0.182-mRNA-1//1//CDS//3329550407//5875//frame0
MADSESSDVNNTEVSAKPSPRKKRESFLGDELLSFDPVEFDSVEADAWGDVFDEEHGNGNDRSGLVHDTSESNEGDSLPRMPLSSNSDSKNNENSEDFVGTLHSKSNNGNPTLRRETSQGSTGTFKNDPSASGSMLTWQDDKRDAVLRLKMIKDISQRLVARKKIQKPNDPIALPRIQAQARAFESQLYKNAASLEEYSERSTLKRRIAQLADRFFSHFQRAKQKSASKLGDNMLKTDMPQSKQSPSVHSLPGPLQGSNMSRRSTSTASSSASQSMESGKMGDFLPSGMGQNANALTQSNQGVNPAVQQNLMTNLQQQQMMAAQQQASMLNLANNPQMLAQNQMMMNNGLPMFQMMQQQQQQGGMMNMNMLQQQNLMRQNAMNMAMMNQQQQQQQMATGGGAFGANMGGMGMNNNPMGNMGAQQGMHLGNFPGMNMMNPGMANPGMSNNATMPQQSNKPNGDTVSPQNFNW